MTQHTRNARSGSSARTPVRQAGTGRRWLGAAAAGIAVVVVVVVVQVATDEEPAVEPVGSQAVEPVAGGGAGPSAEPTTAGQQPAAGDGAGIAADVQLFPPAALPADVVRESVVDPAASWPVAECAPLSIDEPGRIDFVSGSETGPEYSRDLAIAWYPDDAAAAAAYDALVAAVADCAGQSGAELTTVAAGLGTAGSVLTVTQRPVEGASDMSPDAVSADAVSPDAASPDAASPYAASLYAVSHTGPVLVLAVDHATFYTGGPASADSASGTTKDAERLLAEACRVAPDAC